MMVGSSNIRRVILLSGSQYITQRSRRGVLNTLNQNPMQASPITASTAADQLNRKNFD